MASLLMLPSYSRWDLRDFRKICHIVKMDGKLNKTGLKHFDISHINGLEYFRHLFIRHILFEI